MRIHKPVLLQEAVELLDCRSGGFYVDCTAGMGGHSAKILQASSPDGVLLAIDRDEQAVSHLRQSLAQYSGRVHVVHEDYRMLNAILGSKNLPAPNGILADLGASLLQLTQPERGFSFMTDGPLDMRMDRRQELTAADVVNLESSAGLIRILREYGEEPSATRIVRKIVEERKTAPITTTGRLREIIEEVVPRHRNQRIHPATRTFQALRIAVNRELENLDQFLFDAFDSLANDGRLVIIAFHSLEDRTVKQVFQFLSAACRCSRTVPMCRCGGRPLSKQLTRKFVRPGEQEINENPASRSAKMRAIQKISGPAPRDLWQQWLKER
jgi:16S rRNA (cytosine1402-N4)-methyltransferase